MTFGLVARLAVDRLARLPGIFTVGWGLERNCSREPSAQQAESTACDGRHGAA